jgi:hypothetical protein
MLADSIIVYQCDAISRQHLIKWGVFMIIKVNC